MTIRPLFPGEHVEGMLKRLRKGVQSEGINRAISRHSEFTPASARRRSKSNAARRRQGLL